MTPTLLVMILLVSAASVASYLFSQWVPMRSGGRTLAWVGLGGGTVLLLAAAVVMTLSMHSLSTLQLPWKETLPEHMIEPAQSAPLHASDDDPEILNLLGMARQAILRHDWSVAVDALLDALNTTNLSPADRYQLLGYLIDVQEQRQDYVAAAAAMDKLLALPVLPEGERMRSLRRAIVLNYRTQFYADSLRYGREYLAHYPDDDGAVRKILEQANSAYAALDTAVPPEEPRGYEPMPQRAYAPEPVQ